MCMVCINEFMHGVSPGGADKERMRGRHSLRSVFYFHHVLGDLGVRPCSCHIKRSRFLELTLLLVSTASAVMSTA